MTNQRHFRAVVLFLILHVSTLKAAKNSARPVHEVHEVINEQARMDDKRIQSGAPFIPYGNPLAGNSQHNAKLHAQNQQAMFNAERVRQHRAQLQRLNKATQQTDSYMRAYHESQENHQLVLEQQQAKLREFKPSSLVTKPSTPVTRPPPRQRQAKRTRRPDLTKIMQEEAVLTDKSRNHRSYGSVGHKTLHQKMYKTVYVTPGPTYDQGVTIKPNGNVGLTHLEHNEEPTPLYTQAIPSKTQYVYPKQYSQMQHYESAQDIAALNALLRKEPQDQLLELNALVQPDKQTHNEFETPLDLYFYLKDPNLAQHYAQSMYAQIPHNYASAYMPHVKDHTPITEDVDDIEDPNKVAKRPFTPQPVVSTTPKEITTNNINYFSIQPTVPTSADYYQQTEGNPSYAALVYEKPLKIFREEVEHENTSERYLPPNGKHIGVQHLNEDGTGTSAYGDDSLQYAANYEFGYHVRDHHSGNDFGHSEAKKNGNTDGHYHVLLPDGRMQNVKYHAGPDGFHADISYELQ